MALTCSDQYGLAHKKHLECVAKFGLPISVRSEHLLLAYGGKVAQWESWSWSRNLSELESGLPVCAIADHLERHATYVSSSKQQQ